MSRPPSRALQDVLGEHRNQLGEWRDQMSAQGSASQVKRKLETKNEQNLRLYKNVEPPGEKAERLLFELENQVVSVLQKHEAAQNERDSRPWQKQNPGSDFGKSADVLALERTLRQVQDAAKGLAVQLQHSPPPLEAGFLEDVESLIRQNGVLKKEAERSAVQILRLQDELSKAKADVQAHSKNTKQLNSRVVELAKERNQLAEELRHGISHREKEEYAKEIQKLTKIKRQLTEKIGEFLDGFEDQKDKIKTLEADLEKMKKINIIQDEEFKAQVSKLIRDKKDAISRNERMEKKMLKMSMQSDLDAATRRPSFKLAPPAPL